MSRDNSKRITEVVEVATPTVANNQQHRNLLSDVSLSMPTETVELPTRGKFYDKTSTLHNKETIEIKSLTAKEEDILSSVEYIQNGTIFDKLLESIIIDKSINPRELLIGDRNALLLAARISGYGPEYKVKKLCQECGKNTEHVFDLTKNKTKETDLESLGVVLRDNLFWFTLPKTNIEVAIRPLTALDKNRLEKQREKKVNLGLEPSDLIDFLQSIIVEAGGSRDRGQINEFTQIMPAIDSRKIRTIYKETTPDIDTTQSIVCSSCSWESESEVWFGLNFFWPEH